MRFPKLGSRAAGLAPAETVTDPFLDVARERLKNLGRAFITIKAGLASLRARSPYRMRPNAPQRRKLFSRKAGCEWCRICCADCPY